MARAIWTGAINFGLMTVPVGLYSATETTRCTSTNSSVDVGPHQLSAGERAHGT